MNWQFIDDRDGRPRHLRFRRDDDEDDVAFISGPGINCAAAAGARDGWTTSVRLTADTSTSPPSAAASTPSA